MKLFVVATTILHLACAATIADVTCPDSCTCQPKDELLETSCTSYEFIKKLLPKQETTIIRLSINDAALNSVDLKLKYLKNLQSLDLSRNAISSLPSQFPYLPKLKSLNLSENHLSEMVLSQLPKNLRVIDASHNSISSFPKDFSSLKQLKVLYLHDNPIDCDCDNLLIYEQLLKENISIPGDLTCYYPKEFHGRSLKSINCSLIKENLLNSMLGDEPGSGLEELVESREFNPTIVDEDEQFISADGITTEHAEAEEEEEEAGSGFEGSGLIPILPFSETPKACHFNCSTPKPIGLNDETNASPLPSVQEQAKMLFEDILLPEKVTTTTPAATTQPQIKETKEEAINLTEKSDKELVSDVETFPTNDTVVGEMERASLDGSNNQTVYIIVGLLVAFVTFLTIYYVNKRKNQRKINRKRNKSNENGFGEEMKPLGLGKSPDVVKPIEAITSKVPNETAPLLNGKNGTISDDGLKIPAIDETDEDVEIRKPNKMDSLTPQPERVTIKAGELPDSVPKTPLLVHRQLNSDGEIVTTAINSD